MSVAIHYWTWISRAYGPIIIHIFIRILFDIFYNTILFRFYLKYVSSYFFWIIAQSDRVSFLFLFQVCIFIIRFLLSHFSSERSNKVFVSSCKALWPRIDFCHFTDFFICCLPLISNEIFWLKYEFFHMQLHHRILLVYFCCMSPLTFCCYIIVVGLFVLNRIWSRRFSRRICSVI
jgi:hypothetical protein